MGERHRILTTAPLELDEEYTVTIQTFGPSNRGKLLRLVEVTERGEEPFFPRSQAQADRYAAGFNLAKIDPSQGDIAIIEEILQISSPD